METNSQQAGTTENPGQREKLQSYPCTIRQQPSTTPASKKQSSTTFSFSSKCWRTRRPSTLALQRVQSQAGVSRLWKNGRKNKHRVIDRKVFKPYCRCGGSSNKALSGTAHARRTA